MHIHNYLTLLFDIPCINNWPQQYFLNLLLTQSISLSSRSIMSFCSGLMYIYPVETSCWIQRIGYVTMNRISSRFLLFSLHFSKSKPPQFSNWGYSVFNTSWNSSSIVWWEQNFLTFSPRSTEDKRAFSVEDGVLFAIADPKHTNLRLQWLLDILLGVAVVTSACLLLPLPMGPRSKFPFSHLP